MISLHSFIKAYQLVLLKEHLGLKTKQTIEIHRLPVNWTHPLCFMNVLLNEVFYSMKHIPNNS